MSTETDIRGSGDLEEGPQASRLRQLTAELKHLEAEVLSAERSLEDLKTAVSDFEVQYRAKIEWRLQQLEGPVRLEGGTTPELTEMGGRHPGQTARAKRIFRKVARDCHPDFASDADDEERRTQFMARLNEAYETGDPSKLDMLSAEWESQQWRYDQGPASAEDLIVRAAQGIKWARERLDAIARERAHIEATPLAQLMHRVERARRKGRDLLQEMAIDLDQQIARKYGSGSRKVQSSDDG